MPLQENDQSQNRVCLGKVSQAHGVKGLVKLYVFTEKPTMLNGTLYTDEQSNNTLKINLKNQINKYWLAEIEGVHDRDAAEALRSTELWVNRDQLPKTDNEEEYYIEDLVGLVIKNKDKEITGRIKAVNNFGAGDLLDIEMKDGKQLLIPFTKEYVPSVNIEECYITLGDITPFTDS